MNIKSILFVFLVLAAASLFAQNKVISIPYLKAQPLIDGLPDKEISAIEWKNFSFIKKSNDLNEDLQIQYKLAYNYNCLYLLIETNSNSIIYRDRAYQNGDGFHLVIAKTDSGNATNEFYVLRFSPANASKNLPARKGIWYYNVDLSSRSLSSATQFLCQSSNGKTYFELLLPWNEVYPYHPLFSDSIGINLCFVKAVGDIEKNYYFMRSDDYIQSELSRRLYNLAFFEEPDTIINSFSLLRLQNRTIIAGNNAILKCVSFSAADNKVSVSLSVRSADDYIYNGLYKEFKISKGMSLNEFLLPAEKLMPGGYKLVWKSSDNSEGEIPFTILPVINYEKEKQTLQLIRNRISEGDYYTLLFMLQNIIKTYDNIKLYETNGNLRENYANYLNYTIAIQKEPLLFVNKKEVFRRAFLSKVDSTLQPYSIRLPKDYNPAKKYPLYVMLHGSGSDDKAMLIDGQLTEKNFIEIAPFGRGTSNCFTTDFAQIDVKEAIEDVIKFYSVDTTKIIIAGFSMGGYGAYRIFYEYPILFKGVVVFSGHPKLASKWIGDGYPDFLMSKYLIPFKNAPVFIYHSKNDLNCPYDLTYQLVEKLKKSGAKVEFITTTEGGHGIIDKDNLPAYYIWLNKTIEN